MNTFKRKIAFFGAVLTALFISGCAKDQATAKAEADAITAQANVRVAELQAAIEESKAIQKLADKVDATGASNYILVKALKGLGLGQPAVQQQQTQSQPTSLVGLAWQSALQLGDLALRYWGVKANRDVNIIQSNNNRDIALSGNATYQALGQSIERAGMAGYPYVQAPAANVTNLSGQGVIGSGTYTGPVTTTTTTTRSCQGGTGAAGGTATPGGTATSPGGTAGVGGSATGGTC